MENTNQNITIYTKKRESNPNITLKMSSNHKRKEQKRKGRKKMYKNKPKHTHEAPASHTDIAV